MANSGRPRMLDDAKRREICALVTAGCGLPDAARYVGCSASTIRRELLRCDDFKKQLRGAEINAQLESLRAMRQAAATHWRAAAWMLERVNPRRFSRPNIKAYRADEVRAVLEEVIESAVEEIDDEETRLRVCRRLVAAAHRASRA